MKKIILMLSLILTMLLAAGCTSGEKSPEPGTWTGDIYVNEYANLKLILPDGWVASTDEEISELMNMGAEIMKESGAKFSKKALDLQTIYGMMCQNPETGSNVLLMFENLAMSGSSKMTVAEYMDVVKTQMETVAPAAVEFGESYEETVGSATFTVLEMTYPEIPDFSQYYYMSKSGKHMTALIITVAPGDSIESIMAHFS